MHNRQKYTQCSHSRCLLDPGCSRLGKPSQHYQSALQFPSDQSVLVRILTNTQHITCQTELKGGTEKTETQNANIFTILPSERFHFDDAECIQIINVNLIKHIIKHK